MQTVVNHLSFSYLCLNEGLNEPPFSVYNLKPAVIVNTCILVSVEENGVAPTSTEWWAQYLSEEDRFNIEISGKIQLLAEVLRLSESIGDKVLVVFD